MDSIAAFERLRELGQRGVDILRTDVDEHRPRGKRTVLAHDLVTDYLARREVVAELSRDLCAPTCPRLFTSTDPDVVAIAAGAAHGVPMPSFPGMPQVWTLLGQAQVSAIGGADPARTAERLAEAIAEHLGPPGHEDR